jgi:1-pyrroline-5-carboxylate dehydrogenase
MSNFVSAVINQTAYDKITNAITTALASDSTTLLAGGGFSDKVGYFVDPTVLVTTDPQSSSMTNEIFGPVLTCFVYPEDEWREYVKIAADTSTYALTGAIFARERNVIIELSEALKHAAGNFYINDKCTGAVVGQQPFGGARGSGTNDKAGSMWNLIRWVSPRTIKENYYLLEDYRYPSNGE